MEPISISIGGAIAIIGVAVTATAGLIAVIKNLQKPKDFTPDINSLQKETEEIKTHMGAIDVQITELKAHLDGKVDVQINNLSGQLEDLKRKIEKLTDLIIKNLTRGE